MNQDIKNFMRYRLSRIISDLRNGFCVCLVENARKTFFFCNQTIHPEIFNNLPKYQIIATEEYFNHHYNKQLKGNVVLNSDYSFIKHTSSIQNIAIQITKAAELQPILIQIDDTSPIPSVPYETIDVNDISHDIINFRYELTFLAKSPIQLTNAPNSELYAFASKFGGHTHYAILINNPLKVENPLVRIHSSCYTGDLLSSLRCDCRDQLQESISFMNQTNGILLYIMQEGRGIGLANKIIAYNFQQKQKLDTVESNFAVGFQDDERSFVPASKILEYFNKTSIRLITNNPKKVNDLPEAITVTETIPTFLKPNKYNQEYLKVKQNKMGHTIKV